MENQNPEFFKRYGKAFQEKIFQCFLTDTPWAVQMIEVMNPDQYIAEVTDANAELSLELTLAKGIGFVSKEDFSVEKTEIGNILVDAIFSPIRKVNYEVENMRVGDRTDYNLLRINLETDGSLSAKEALESAISIMIAQFKSILDLKETEEVSDESEELDEGVVADEEETVDEEERVELLKT